MEANNRSRGMLPRLFGVILIFLGMLNSLLSWRGGLVVNDFYLLLIATGLFLFAMGVIHRAQVAKDTAVNSPGTQDEYLGSERDAL